MSNATLLFAGPRLPYHVLDYAINWAKENEGTLNVLYLVPGKLPEEGYLFPSDLDEAENMTRQADAEKGMKEIIQEEIRFIEKRCKASHVPEKAEVLFEPELQQVVKKLNESDVIFVDKNVEENDDDMSDLSFNMDDLHEKTSQHFVAVGEMDRYSDVFY